MNRRNTNTSRRRSYVTRDSLLVGLCVVSGLVSLYIAVITPLQVSTTLDLVSFIARYKTLFYLSPALVFLWAACSATALKMSSLLPREPESRFYRMQRVSALVGASGIVLLATGIVVGKVLVMLALQSGGASADILSRINSYTNLSYWITGPGRILWGVGMMLSGVAALKTGTRANWLSVVLIIGGIAGPMTVVIYGAALSSIQFAGFAIWQFHSARLLGRDSFSARLSGVLPLD